MFDPVTGQPYSDRSKLAAGLLQLIPGFLMCIAGVGRLYAGQTGLGVLQLIGSIFAWIMLICLFWLVVPIFLFIGMWLWGVIDGIVLLAGRPVDGYGRLLRP
jgi:TM2 domain-containing membrane protein YozV